MWLETMSYGAEESAAMMRMDPATVSKIRDNAAELLLRQPLSAGEAASLLHRQSHQPPKAGCFPG